METKPAVKPQAPQKPTTEERRAARQLRKPFLKAIYSKNKLALSIAVFGNIGIAAVQVALAYLMQELLDVATSGTVTRLVEMIWLTLAFFIATGFFLIVMYYSEASYIRKAMRQYKQLLFEKITRKSVSSFAGEATGRYISALTNDAASVDENYVRSLFSLVMSVVYFFGSLALMFWYSWSMTLVVLALCVLPMAVSLLSGNRLAEREKEISNRNESFVGMVKDLLTGFPVIKSFKAEKEILKLYSKENTELEQTRYRRKITASWINIVSNGAGFIVQMGVFLYGAYLAVKGDITAGVMIAFVQLMNFVLEPLRTLPPLFANRKAALGLVDKVAAAVEENAERKGMDIAPVLKDSISLDNVTFAYEEDDPVLRGVTERFEAGKSYAIVGGSGSGKSTLLNLLMGSHERYGGSIRYDGTELREISSESLFELVSIIQQNVFVFDNTIANNITMFKEFPEEKLQSAIERAGLAELMQERGGDYRCGENGAGLSGGERQRISIARCLLRGTPVLMMDEATAALDAATAKAVTDSILSIGGLTRIIVTHKLEESTLRRFDGILVLSGGKVAERGDFDSLMARREYFYSLFTVAKAEQGA